MEPAFHVTADALVPIRLRAPLGGADARERIDVRLRRLTQRDGLVHFQPLTLNPLRVRTSRTRSRSSPCSSMALSATDPPVPHARFSSPQSSLRNCALFGRS